VKLGTETGNVVYDQARGWFWITVVTGSRPDRLVAVDAVDAKVATTIDVPGCDGAHALRLHPDGQSALIACEGNDMLARVELGGAHGVVTARTGSAPDVLAIDPDLGWLYVAAESGDLTVFDLRKPGVVLIGHDHPGEHTHSVAVDPVTHHVFFPLIKGPNGSPVLRIMVPAGT
jgi:DNA-binding beta-propeller fold protein YncE